MIAHIGIKGLLAITLPNSLISNDGGMKNSLELMDLERIGMDWIPKFDRNIGIQNVQSTGMTSNGLAITAGDWSTPGLEKQTPKSRLAIIDSGINHSTRLENERPSRNG
jgi:hypothetical protein